MKKMSLFILLTGIERAKFGEQDAHSPKSAEEIFKLAENKAICIPAHIDEFSWHASFFLSRSYAEFASATGMVRAARGAVKSIFTRIARTIHSFLTAWAYHSCVGGVHTGYRKKEACSSAPRTMHRRHKK